MFPRGDWPASAGGFSSPCPGWLTEPVRGRRVGPALPVPPGLADPHSPRRSGVCRPTRQLRHVDAEQRFTRSCSGAEQLAGSSHLLHADKRVWALSPATIRGRAVEARQRKAAGARARLSRGVTAGVDPAANRRAVFQRLYLPQYTDCGWMTTGPWYPPPRSRRLSVSPVRHRRRACSVQSAGLTLKMPSSAPSAGRGSRRGASSKSSPSMEDRNRSRPAPHSGQNLAS